MSEAQTQSLEDQIGSFDPTNPEALAALEKSVLGGDAVEAEPQGDAEVETPEGEAKPAEKQDEKKAEPDAAAVDGASSGVKEPKGVQARDGDHIIPYSVLERERRARAQAEAMLQAQADEIQRLKAGGNTEEGAAKLSDEFMTQLDNDLPAVAQALRAQQTMIEQLTGAIGAMRSQQQAVEKVQQMSVEDEIEAAISGNPDLKAWRDAAQRQDNPDPLMWNRAADANDMLFNDPDWRDKPFAERFAKAVDVVKTLYGAPATAAQQQQQPQDLKRAADAALAAQPAPVPASLSDIPGGTPPSQSHRETVEAMSAVALGNRFLNMSPDQIEAELARIG